MTPTRALVLVSLGWLVLAALMIWRVTTVPETDIASSLVAWCGGVASAALVWALVRAVQASRA